MKKIAKFKTPLTLISGEQVTELEISEPNVGQFLKAKKFSNDNYGAEPDGNPNGFGLCLGLLIFQYKVSEQSAGSIKMSDSVDFINKVSFFLKKLDSTLPQS